MEFEVTDGLDLISIRMEGIVNYFRFKSPLSVAWSDCQGSVAKYLCVLPYSEEYRKEVRNRINQNIFKDFSENTQELYELISPLLKLFANGRYTLSFCYNAQKEYFAYKSSSDNYETVHYNPWSFYFPEATDIKEEKLKIKEHKKRVSANAPHHWDILVDTTAGFYDFWETSFIATEPKEAIQAARVAYFEKLIKAGQRPFIIIFNSYYEGEPEINSDGSTSSTDYRSENYVLDGHHKLLAYHNLNIPPPIAEISHCPKHMSEINFDVEVLRGRLFPWQLKHIIEHTR